MEIGIGIGMTFATARAWSPMSLGGSLLEWWTADAGITQSGGGSVSAWAGRKNGYTVSQSTGSARPAFSADGFGGRACLIHDGIDDCLYNVAATGWFPTGSNPMEIWVVCQQDAPAVTDTALRCVAALGNSSFNTDMRLRRQDVSGVNRFQVTVGNGSGATTASYAGVNFGSRHAVRLRAETAQVVYTVDGNTPATAANAKSVDATQFGIGSTPNGSAQFWLGRIRHVVVTSPLTDDQAAQLTTYLMQERYL